MQDQAAAPTASSDCDESEDFGDHKSKLDWRRCVHLTRWFCLPMVVVVHIAWHVIKFLVGSLGSPLLLDNIVMTISCSAVLACWVFFEYVRVESSMLTCFSCGGLFFLWGASIWSAIGNAEVGLVATLISVDMYYLCSFGALLCRVRLVEHGFGGNLASRCILCAVLLEFGTLCRNVVSWLGGRWVVHYDFISVWCSAVACITVTCVVAWSMTAAKISASSPLTGCNSPYILAEAAWAQQVIRRTCIASVIPPAVISVLILCGDWVGLHPLVLPIVAVLDLCSFLVLVGYIKPSPLPVVCSDGMRHSLTRADPIVSGDPAWRAKVSELAHRSISVGGLLDFYCKLGAGGEVMHHFHPHYHTTNDVVRSAIVPLSRLEGRGGVAYSSLGAADCPEEGTLPECMVTHDWRNLFVHLVAAVVANSMGHDQYHKVAADLVDGQIDDVRDKVQAAGGLERRYWICAFCVNQHSSICDGFGRPPPNDLKGAARWEANCHDSLTSDLLPRCHCTETKHFNDSPASCELNKFDSMMGFLLQSVPGFRQLVAVDRKFDIFTRLWCIAELVEASLSAMPQEVCLFSDKVLGIDNEDLSIYIKLASLTAADCCATRPEDKAAILAKIPNVHEFDAQLQALIFGTRGLLASRLVGTDIFYAAVRASLRVSAISERIRNSSDEIEA